MTDIYLGSQDIVSTHMNSISDLIIDVAPENTPNVTVQNNSLTGYPNIFVTTLQNTIDNRDKSLHAALIMLSLNNLPMMISGYGHKATEEAITNLLFSLKSLLKDKGDITINRIQKDQLAIIIDASSEHNFDVIEQSIQSHIKHFGHNSQYGAMHILASSTCITLPEQSVDADDLLNEAYIALKNEPTGEHDVIVKDSKHSRQEMNMVNYITNAIKDQQLCLAFQPIICSTTGQVAHYEALLRVIKENGELTTAGPLIPVAERMGLIDMIDELVLDMVVKELMAAPKLKLAFNVSNLTTNSAVWLKKLEQVSKSHPDVVSRMMIEITETAVHLDLRRTAYFVATVQSYGALVALDDFGSGYTSFRQLKSLSIDVIKIDGVFVKDLVGNHDNLLFIKTMLDFTNGFGLKTVAEFVENGETAKLLMDLGVEYMQGYYFGFPEAQQDWNKS